MTGWHKASMVGFDLETTGVNLESDRIVTACVALIRPGHETEIRSTVINPGIEVPDAAAKIHGWTTERVQAEGKDPAVEVEWIAADLAPALRAGVPVVGMNCVFDLTILDRELRRLDLPTLEDRIGGPTAPVVDVFVIDKALDRYRKGSRKLADLCTHYGVRIDGAHDATFDALAAARVAYRMGQRSQMDAEALRAVYADRKFPDRLVRDWQAFGRMDLAALHAAQAKWYPEQTESFAQYLRREEQEARGRLDVALAGGDAEAAAIADQEAAELAQRIDGLSYDWPVRSTPPAVT